MRLLYSCRRPEARSLAQQEPGAGTVSGHAFFAGAAVSAAAARPRADAGSGFG